MSASMDDWYVLGSGMVVTETSVDVYNRSLYELAKSPRAALSWHRVMAANLLARDGAEWAERVSAFNSGEVRAHGAQGPAGISACLPQPTPTPRQARAWFTPLPTGGAAQLLEGLRLCRCSVQLDDS